MFYPRRADFPTCGGFLSLRERFAFAAIFLRLLRLLVVVCHTRNDFEIASKVRQASGVAMTDCFVFTFYFSFSIGYITHICMRNFNQGEINGKL